MKPIKIYPNRENPEYKSLVKAFDKEKSMLGSDVNVLGEFYLIIDLDNSPIMQDFLKSYPQFVDREEYDGTKN